MCSPPVQILLAAVGIARLDEVRHGGGEQLRVDTQVVLLLQILSHRVGQAAHPQLDAVAVVDQIRHSGRSCGPSPWVRNEES